MPRRRSNLNNQQTRASRRINNARNNRRDIVEEEQDAESLWRNRLRQTNIRARTSRQNIVNARRTHIQVMQQTYRALSRASFHRLAFDYAPDIDYSSHAKVRMSNMDKECQYCRALKFQNEPPGMCCASGKVSLPPLSPVPETLRMLLNGESDESKLFLRKIRKFNSCFQMTSFGATKMFDHRTDGRNFESTFKIQGQIYHRIGSLMHPTNESPKFLQIYFMGSDEERVSMRCQCNFIERIQERAVVNVLENLLGSHNQLIQLFKRVAPRLINDNYQIVIKADKVPSGQHAGRFNAPTVDEIAVIMIGDPVESRDIKITRRDNTVHSISELHRSYDALQYPLIFWDGQDGYHINIKQQDPVTAQLKKKTSVSSSASINQESSKTTITNSTTGNDKVLYEPKTITNNSIK